MAWTVELSNQAKKHLKTLDRSAAKRILTFLFERISPLENPRSIGEALHGPTLGNYWKYRVGDYRMVCHIDDKTVTITVIKIGHRKDVYRHP